MQPLKHLRTKYTTISTPALCNRCLFESLGCGWTFTASTCRLLMMHRIRSNSFRHQKFCYGRISD